MDHPLQQRIADVRNHARQVVWQSAVYRFMIAVLSTLLVAGLVDYGFRIHDRGLQVMLSLFVAATVVVAAYRFFGPARGYHPSDVKVARHIEMRYPAFEGSLSSSVEFLKRDSTDPRTGSRTLRRKVIDQAAVRMKSIDFWSVVDHGAPQRLKRTLLCLVVGIVLILCCAPPSRLAARRLVSPLGSPDWPRRHMLVFESVPSTIAVGADLDLAVVDGNGQLPAAVQLIYLPTSETGSDPMSQTVQELVLRDGRMVGTIENVTRSLRYRAVGGDDDRMPWQEVRVIEPPRINELQIVLHPPAYTGWPEEIVEEGIRALVGTRVAIQGRSDLAIASARLRVHTPQAEQEMVAAVAADSRTFHISADQSPAWVVEASGFFSIAVQDRQGMELPNHETWEIRAAADIAPTIVWRQPRDGASITRHAKVSLQLTVSDDLAVRSVIAEYRRSDRPEEGWVPCHALDLSQRPPAERVHPEGQGESHTLNWEWNVANLVGLTPDLVLEVRAVAEDYLPQSSASDVRRFQVVTHSQLQRRLDSRQAELLLGLTDLLGEQQVTRRRTAQMVTQLQAPTPRPLSVASVRNLESAQRRIRQRLATDEESLLVKLQELADAIRANQLGNPAADRIHKLTEILRRLDRSALPAAEEQLFAASQIGADPKAPLEQLVQSLQSARMHQEDVLKSLESSVGDLTGWDKRQRIARDLEGIIGRQEQLKVETQRVWRTTITQDPPTDEDRLAVDGLSRRQQELTRYLERVSSQMATIPQEIEATDATTAEAVARALAVGQVSRVASHMQRSVERIREQRLAEAATLQQLVTDGLRAMRHALLPGRPQVVSLPSESRQIRELQRHAQEMAEQQQVLVDETRRMDALRKGQRLPTAADLAPVRDLAGRQRALSATADRQARSGSQPAVYQFAFRRVVREMDRATEHLLRRQTDETTRRFQQRARQGLLAIVDSLEFAPSREGQSSIPPTSLWPASRNEPAQSPSPQSADLVTLRLMRQIQAEIRQRTAQLLTLENGHRLLSDAERQELDQLSRDQGDLAQLVSQLTGSNPRRQSPEAP